MSRSLHDNVLVAYEVQSEARRITLRTEFRETHPAESTQVVFTGVEGYHFRDDAFGNILFDVETVSVEKILADHGAEIRDSFRRAGSPGAWAERLDTAAGWLKARHVRGFVISSSVGMSGWVLARDAAILPTPRAIEPPTGPDASSV